MKEVAKPGSGLDRTLDAFVKAGGGLKGFTAGIGTLVAAHPVITALAGLAATAAVLNYVSPESQRKRANEEMDNAYAYYDEAKAKAAELNDELATTQNRINELSSKGGLTLVEQGELNKLKEASRILEMQKTAAEKEEIQASKDAAAAALKSYKTSFRKEISESAVSEYANPDGAYFMDAYDISSIIAGIKFQKEHLKNVEEVYGAESEQYQLVSDIIERQTSNALSRAVEISGYIEKLRAGNFNGMYNDDISSMEKQVDFIWKTLDYDSWKQMNYTDLFNNDSLRAARDSLVESAKASDNIAITAEQVKGAMPGIESQLEGTGITLQDIVDDINSRAGIIDVDKVRKNVKDMVSAWQDALGDSDSPDKVLEQGKEFQSWIDSLSASDLKVVWDIIIQQGKNGLTFEQLQEKYQQAKEGTNKPIQMIVSTEFMEKESGRVDSLKNYVSESLGSTGLSANSMQEISKLYSSIEGYDIDTLFTRTEMGIRLNVDALNELDTQYRQLRKDEITNQLQRLRKEYDKTAESLKDLTEDKEAYDAANARMTSIKKQIQETMNLENQFDSLYNAYNKWIIAQGTTSSSEKYESIGSAYDNMKAIYEAGWKGDKSLNAYLDLMLGSSRPGSIDDAWAMLSKPAANGISNSLLDYYTKDSNGVVNTDGLFKFLGDVNTLLGDEFASYDKELNQWKFDFSGDKLGKVAETLNTSEEYINTITDALERAGFKVTRANGDADTDGSADNGLNDSASALSAAAGAHVAAAGAIESAAGAFEAAVKQKDNANGAPTENDLAAARAAAFAEEQKRNAAAAAEIAAKQAKDKERIAALAAENDLAAARAAAFAEEKERIASVEAAKAAAKAAGREAAEKYAEDPSAFQRDIDEARSIGLGKYLNLIEDPIDVPVKPVIEDEIETPVELPAEPVIDPKQTNEQIRKSLLDKGIIGENEFNNLAEAANNPNSKLSLYGNEDGTFTQKIIPELYYTEEELRRFSRELQDGLNADAPEVEVGVSNRSLDEMRESAQEEIGLFKSSFAIMTESVADARRVLNKVKSTQKDVFGKDTPFIDSLLSMSDEALMSQISSWRDEYIGQGHAYDSKFTISDELLSQVPVEGELTSVDPAGVQVDIPANANIVSTSGLSSVTLSATAAINKVTGTNSIIAGSAEATGNAFASGTIGAKGSGEALGGELGEEIVVRNNRYFTIGKNGAEFFKYRKGDIIFNAEQTKQLLKNGAISRGKVRGTAFAEGTIRDKDGKLLASSASSLISSTVTQINGNIYVGTGPGTNKPNTSSSSSEPSQWTDSDPSASNGSGDEKVDWIEVAIDRIERAIKKLTDTAANAFTTLTKRTEASSNAIQRLNEEILVQQAAEKRYLEEAEKVDFGGVGGGANSAIPFIPDSVKQYIDISKLFPGSVSTESGEDIKELIRNGKIDINGYDKETKKKIEEYRQWYEKSLASGEAVAELHRQIAQLYQDSFEMAQKDAEDRIAQVDHTITRIESRLEAISESGYLASTSLYGGLIDIETQRASMLRDEYTELQNRLKEAIDSGEIEEESEAFYEMQNAINDVEESIDDSNAALIEYANKIREIEWERFDYAQDRISATVSEVEFMIDLLDKSKLFDEDGIMNEKGIASVGLYAQKYNLFMAQADAYANEIANINREMANDPYNTNLIKRREELLKLQQQSIISAEKEKQSISSLVEDGIKKQLSALKELISEYEDSLDSAKDLYEYQKDIEKQTQKIADIEKQIAAYTGNDSEEARAKLQKLRNDLTEAQENLQDTEYEKYVSDQKEMLDDLYDKYEETLNARLDDVDALISEMIDLVDSSSSEIRGALLSAAANVGYTITGEMDTFWSTMNNSFSETISRYGADFSEKINGTNTILSGIYSQIEEMIAHSESLGSGLYPLVVSGSPVALTGIANRSLRSESSGNTENSGVRIENMSINIPIDHIDDYDDFVTKIRDDKQFERFIQSITTNVVAGGSSLDKYSISWK